jgi:nicotinate-nucleotide adenylyltransferase
MDRRGLVRAVTLLPARRMGVLGGTFDPIHLGHVAIARLARDGLGLEEVLVIPTGIPPHKQDQPITPAEDRMAMIELAIAGEPWLIPSRLELGRPGPSYAVDTMALLVERESAAADPRDIYSILSAEAVAGLPAWKDPDRLLALCRLAIVPRHGAGLPSPEWIDEHFPGRGDRFVAVAGPDIPISASTIRRIAGEGGSLDGLVAPAVARYIVDHGLYTGDAWRTS